MPVLDLRKLPAGQVLNTDVCIVGAGAAGLTLASSLIEAGREVCVLEAGGLGPEEETQALYELQCAGYPLRENHMPRARYYGGSCNLWAGRAMKLTPQDIGDRPWLGGAAPAWPLPYSQLDHYYGEAARLLKLPAVPPADMRDGLPGVSGDEDLLLQDSELSGNLALWAKKPLRFGRAFRHLFRRSRGILCLHANVSEILLDSAGSRAQTIVARSLDGAQARVQARSFVLAAGGLENARLLLVSRRQQSEGIGNRHDLVGRYFMEHPRVVFGSVTLQRPVDLRTVLGSPTRDGKMQLGIGLSQQTQRREGLVNSYLSLEKELSNVAQERYRSSVGVMKVLLRRGHAGGRLDWSAMRPADLKDMIYLLTPKEILPYGVYRTYVAFRRRLFGQLARGRLTIINYCEQLPDRQSRVYLSDERDQLNMPTLVLDWRIGEETRRSIVHLHRSLDAALRRSGLGRVDSRLEDLESLTFTDASHHMGTTRMSDHPREGVVDRNCRVHGLENLFIAGSSVFPTSGNANPTWTIVALALRLADHLKSH